MYLELSKLLSLGHPPETIVAHRGGMHITFGQFMCDVTAVSLWLEKKQAQEYVMAVQDSYLFAVSFLALVYTGRGVLLPTNTQTETLSDFEKRAGAILDDETLEVALLAASSLPNNSMLFDTLNPELCEISFFTSGSAGVPKKIGKTLSQIEIEIDCLEAIWGEALKGSLTIATVSHQHIYGLLFKVFWPLCAGRPFLVEPLEYWEQIHTQLTRPCCLVASPAHLSRYPNSFSLEWSAAPHMVFSSGGPLAFVDAQESLTRLHIIPIEIYGSTETGGIGYRQQIDGTTPWTPFDSIELRIAHGVLQLRSPYIKTSGWYLTNDLVDIRADGDFVLKGRNDKIVKIEEKRVSLPEVEKFLEDHDLVCDASVLVLDGARVTLACVAQLTSQGEEIRKQEGDYRFSRLLRAAMAQRFEPMALPKRWRFVDQIPENTEGKRLHRVLAALFN